MEQTQNIESLEVQEKLIIVTGFGPFVGHEKINASWEAVRLLPAQLTHNESIYRLELEMVPVEYEAVDHVVKQIWARNPALVIHCGVNGTANCVNVEQRAYNHQFNRPDYAGQYLTNGGSACLSNSCAESNDDIIHCGLNVERIVERIADACGCTPTVTDGAITDAAAAINKPPAKVSKDVGSYLCGYIYLKSLDMNSKRTLFVHVPPVDKPFSSSQTADIIEQIVVECVRQVEEDIMDTC